VQGISAYSPALGPTVPPIQWVSLGVSQGKVAGLESVKLTIHLQLVCRLRISAATTSSHDMYTGNFTLNFITCIIRLGTMVALWLRCCATNRKVAGSIPAGVIGFFIDIKSF